MRFFLACIALAFATKASEGAVDYYGKYLGPLSRLMHGVSGEVYAVDARTLHIRDYTYDGEGPAAYFYAGNTKAPGPGGFRIRDENGSAGPLKRYRKKHVTLTLPEGKTLSNIRWFSVWCEEFAVNFGDVSIPRSLDYPKPQKVAALNGVHGVSSDNVVIVDAQTLLIPSFSYDGEAPDAKFWVGRGSKPSPQGIKVPDENGKLSPLRRYERKTIVLTLPGDLTVFDIGHFGVWCEAFTVDFGHIQVPSNLNVPPSLKMLGVSPQSKLNCEVLSDELAYEVRWAVAGDSVVIQLVAKLEEGEYMSFGLSGDDKQSVMVGADVVVAWVDQNTLNGYAVDYFLDAKAQCAGQRGSCPDFRIEPNTESVRLLNAALVNGYSIVTYQRPLMAHDGLDRPILINQSQPIIWAVGPLNSKKEVSYHSITSKGDVYLNFGRPPKWHCPIPETDAAVASSATSEDIREDPVKERPERKEAPRTTVAPLVYKTVAPPAPAPTNGAWEIPPIQCNEPEDGVFYAQMGPTGGKRGYSAITGHVGWGISFYINGLLIPEINVVRGKTYTFVVEGGKDENVPAKYHPFYITDSAIGGYLHRTPEEKRRERVFAGVEVNKQGEAVPTGVGRLCNWTPDQDQPISDEFASFGAYQRTLTLICDHGEPGVVQWTPDANTPDTVYYQCFTHRYLGWKINVHDRCDQPEGAGSEPIPSHAYPEEEELISRPSQRVTTRVKPDFGPQSLSNRGKTKFGLKESFPYEIVKPTVETDNVSEVHVIPVTEMVEDIPQEITTVRQVTESSVVEYTPSALPLINRPGMNLVRNSYNNVRPNRRPPMVGVRPRPTPQQSMMHMAFLNQRPMHQIQGRPPMMVKKQMVKQQQRPQQGYAPQGFSQQGFPQQGYPQRLPQIMPQVLPQASVLSPTRLSPKPLYVHKYKKPVHPTTPVESLLQEKRKLQPSQMIAQSSEEITPRLPLAVNTGFDPGSLVIEGGFRPILTQNQSIAQDRISEDVGDYEDNVEGVIMMDDAEEHKSQTEMFEPMFIPSPLDSNQKHSKKPTTEPVKKVSRKPPRRVVVVRRPTYEEDDEVMDEAAQESSDSFHVAPRKRTTLLTYDGKPVTGSDVPAVPPPPRTLSRGSAVLQSGPQFGPFRGEKPPPVPTTVSEDIPQLSQRSKTRPIPPIALQLKGEEPEEEGVEESLEDEEPKERKRRSPDHVPGHRDSHDHLADHDHTATHDHTGTHDHSPHKPANHDHTPHKPANHDHAPHHDNHHKPGGSHHDNKPAEVNSSHKEIFPLSMFGLIGLYLVCLL